MSDLASAPAGPNAGYSPNLGNRLGQSLKLPSHQKIRIRSAGNAGPKQSMVVPEIMLPRSKTGYTIVWAR